MRLSGLLSSPLKNKAILVKRNIAMLKEENVPILNV